MKVPGSVFGLLCVIPLVGVAVHAETKTVIMKSISYDPKTLEIKVGDEVEWENKSHTQHSATADEGPTFDTKMIAPEKKSKKIEFSKSGTFTYHCSLHGKTMSGEIVVK